MTLPPSVLGGYVSLAVLLGLTVFAAVAPREGVFAAIVLIPVGFPLTVPHTFTTAPSDFLIAGALLTLMLRFVRSPDWNAATVAAMAIPIVVAGTTALALAVNFAELSDAEQIKQGVSELVGIGLASSIPLALVLGLRTLADLEGAILVATIALGIALAAGFLGVFENVACWISDTGGLFVMPSGRAGGLAANPNLFGAQISVLVGPAVIWCLRSKRHSTAVALLGGALTATVVAFIGSRAAWATFLLFAGIWSLHALWYGRLRLPALTCLAIAVATPTVWTALPCPLTLDVGHRVQFSERNDELAYFERLGITMAEAPTELRLREEFAEARSRFRTSWFDFDGGSDRREATSPATGASEASASMTAIVATVSEALHAIAARVPLDLSREYIWDLSIDIWESRPLFGIGPAGLHYVLPRGWRAHNTYLTTLAESGAFGLGGLLASFLLVLVLVACCRRVFREHTAVAIFLILTATTALAGAGSQDIVRQPMFWLAPGLLLVLHMAARRAGTGADMPKPPAGQPPGA